MPPRVIAPAHPDELLRGAPGWPRGLDDLPDAPASVRIAGSLPALQHAVGIVGTRYADPEAVAFARALAADLASTGVAIVSGGARGIDRAAHEGALDAGGRTVAVLPAGLDPVYPPRHAPLFAAIAGQGALLTEMPDGTPPRAGTFLRRNRLIAALAGTVVVVQAPHRSGALSTAAWARKLGRRVLAVPGAPWDPRAGGVLWLLGRGAGVCTSASDVLSVPAAATRRNRARPRQRSRNSPDVGMLEEDVRAVFALLGPTPRHPDELASSLGIAPARAAALLLDLELRGLAVSMSGSYRRALG